MQAVHFEIAEDGRVFSFNAGDGVPKALLSISERSFTFRYLP
jgi:hypothetical protein